MKVLYITSPAFFDADLSFIRALKKRVQLIVLIDLPAYALKQTALQLETQPEHDGIFPISEISGFEQYSDFLGEETYVLNRPKGKLLSMETLRANKAVRRFIRFHRPDVVHYNNPIAFHGISSIRMRTPKLLTIHDPIPHLGESRKNLLIRKMNMRRIPNTVLLNNFQREAFIREYKLVEHQVYRSRLGVYEYYAEVAQKEQHTESKQVLFFGRITPYKGLNVLLEAFAVLRKEEPDARLIIAGNGSFDFSPFDLTGVEIINRFVPSTELQQLITASAMVVCPYVEATQSGVVMTAYAFRKPVIGTRVGGLPEMIIDGETGVLVDANDIGGLKTAMAELVCNSTKRNALANGIERNYFGTGESSWSAIADGLSAIYHQVLKEKK